MNVPVDSSRAPYNEEGMAVGTSITPARPEAKAARN
jgi:hypothetical protein